MNKILLVLLILLPIISLSQKCNYEKDKIDENSNLIVKRTSSVTLCKVNNYPFNIKSQQIGERKYLKLRYFKYNNFSITEGSKLIFYTENNGKIMIDPLEIKKKKTESSAGFATTSSLIVFQLTNDEFNFLIDYPIIEIGFYSNTGITKKEIKAKQQNVIQNLLKCIQ